MIPPPEFYPEGNVICKLKRALYGVGNAPRLWQDHFASVMEKNNFKIMKGDPNLYVRKHKRLYILCYVDDLTFFGSQPGVQAAISDLSKDLMLKVTGHLTDGKEVTSLRRNIKRRDNSFELDMSGTYIKNLLSELELESATPIL